MEELLMNVNARIDEIEEWRNDCLQEREKLMNRVSEIDLALERSERDMLILQKCKHVLQDDSTMSFTNKVSDGLGIPVDPNRGMDYMMADSPARRAREAMRSESTTEATKKPYGDVVPGRF